MRTFSTLPLSLSLATLNSDYVPTSTAQAPPFNLLQMPSSEESESAYFTEKHHHTASQPPLDPKGLQLESLSIDDIGKANRSAQLDGVAAGACAFPLASLLSSRLFKQSKNVALLSGLLAATATGYLFTQASLSTHLAQASKASTLLREKLAADGATTEQLMKFDKEGGTQGLELYEDKYASTRGDH